MLLNNNYSIDWFSFTCDNGITYNDYGKPDVESIDFINKLFKHLNIKHDFNYFEMFSSGNLGFRYYQDIQDGIQIRYNGPLTKENKHCWRLEIKGRGCDFLETIDDWLNLFIYLKPLDINIKRIDFAIDDFNGDNITFPYLYDKIIKDLYILRRGCKKNPLKYIPVNSEKTGNITEGMTLELYSKSSNIQLVIYDKQYEQQLKNNVILNTKQWVRYEMRFKDEKGDYIFNNFFNYLYSNNRKCLNEFLSSCLASCLELKCENENNIDNISDLTIDSKWSAFIGDIKSINFQRIKSKNTDIFKFKEWCEKSISKGLLKMFYVCQNIDFMQAWLKELIINSIGNLKDKDYNDINNQRCKMNLKALTKDEFSIDGLRFNEVEREVIENIFNRW